MAGPTSPREPPVSARPSAGILVFCLAFTWVLGIRLRSAHSTNTLQTQPSLRRLIDELCVLLKVLIGMKDALLLFCFVLFLVASLGSFKCRIMPSANRDDLASSFPLGIHFLFWSY